MSSLSKITLAATIHAIRRALQHSQSQQGQFLWWGLDDSTPEHGTFAQITGLTQLAQLSAYLLNGLLPEAHYPALSKYCGAINAYFFYEIISDNLAHGFGPLAERDATYRQRRALLHRFNEAMIARLWGDQAEAIRIMDELKLHCQTVSSLDHNLNVDKRDAVLKAYAAATGASPETAEFDLWTLLHQNIEACARLLDLMKDSPLRESLREGLILRYQALNDLMNNDLSSLDEVLDSSTWTILIAPTLVYYTAVLVKTVPISQPLDDGLLNQAAYSAAALVRLLNDLGTLVTLPQSHFRSQMDFLQVCYQENPNAYPDIASLILTHAPAIPDFTRLHKDLYHGEHNVALYRLATNAPVVDLLGQFENNLHHCRRDYQQQHIHLKDLLERLSVQLGDDRPSQLIERIVAFHKRMYAVPFEERAGEYAI